MANENPETSSIDAEILDTGNPPQAPTGSDSGMFPNGVSIVKEMREAYRDYSMSVIVGRALPDIRDGLKPVHRRILYAMHSEGLLSDKKYSKCAGVVGEVLKKYHPHGDSAVYDALVRMAQPWNMGVPLINGQGNFGSVDGDPAAAYRYTEARLHKVAEELLADIGKNTVDFIPNFDGSAEEPAVLPTRVPNLLVNGSEGIAVAMATRCPPHNLGEVIDALLAIIQEQYFEGEKVDLLKLLTLMPGPDFPTGGMICGQNGIRKAYETGKGSIRIRGRAELTENKKGRAQIVIDQIPYQVNKSRLIEKIADLVRDKKIDGISEIRDESDRDGMRIAIDLKRDAVGEIVLNRLYKHTALESSFPINMLAIVGGRPKTLSMREVLESFVDFRREVVTRRSRYELSQLEKRFHIIAGLLVALDDIDRIITIIRTSKTSEEAKRRLQEEQFQRVDQIALFVSAPTKQIAGWQESGHATLDAAQAQAILDMRLARLVGLERDKLEKEGEEILASMARLHKILGDLSTLMGVISDELREIKEQYAIPRRTKLSSAIEDLDLEDLIAEERVVVTVSHRGYVKRGKLTTYKAQKRGGKGRAAAKTRDEDFIERAFVASTHAYILVFSDRGRVFWLKVHAIPEAGPTSKGRPIVNLLKLDKDESIKAIVPVREFPKAEGEAYIMTCTRLGQVKKTDLIAYSRPRASGLLACGIKEGDELLTARVMGAKDEVLLTTAHGQAVRFKEDDVREMGRTAAGVKGVTLVDDDRVVAMNRIEPDLPLLTISQLGYGKRTPLSEYPTQKRGGKGVITLKTTSRNGHVASALQVDERDDVMVVTNGGKAIRLRASEVSVIGRNTQGVRILNVNDDEHVIAVARIRHEDESNDEVTEPGVKNLDAQVAAKEPSPEGSDKNA